MSEITEKIKIIYSQESKPSLELSPKSCSQVILKIKRLDAYRIQSDNYYFFDLNPLYGKTISHWAVSCPWVNKFSFYVGEDDETLKRVFKNLDLVSPRYIANGNSKDFFKIKKFGSVNLFVDTFHDNSHAEYVYEKLETNDILISTKHLRDTYPIDELEVSFLKLKSKTTLYFYRKGIIPGGIPSRFGIT